MCSFGEQRPAALLQANLDDPVTPLGLRNQDSALFHRVTDRLLQVHVLTCADRLQGRVWGANDRE